MNSNKLPARGGESESQNYQPVSIPKPDRLSSLEKPKSKGERPRKEKRPPISDPEDVQSIHDCLVAHDNAVSEDEIKQAREEDFAFENIMTTIPHAPNASVVNSADTYRYLLKEAQFVVFLLENTEPDPDDPAMQDYNARQHFLYGLLEIVQRENTAHVCCTDKTNLIGKDFRQNQETLAAVVLTKVRPKYDAFVNSLIARQSMDPLPLAPSPTRRTLQQSDRNGSTARRNSTVSAVCVKRKKVTFAYPLTDDGIPSQNAKRRKLDSVKERQEPATSNPPTAIQNTVDQPAACNPPQSASMGPVARVESIIRKHASAKSEIQTILSGLDLVNKAVCKGIARLVLLGSDDESKLMLHQMCPLLPETCKQKGILYLFVESSKKLGSWAGLPPTWALCLISVDEKEEKQLADLKNMYFKITTANYDQTTPMSAIAGNAVGRAAVAPNDIQQTSATHSQIDHQATKNDVMAPVKQNLSKLASEPSRAERAPKTDDDPVKEGLALEENALMHDSTLESLKQRKSSLNKELASKVKERKSLLGDIAGLETKRSELQHQLTGHHNICDKLSLSSIEIQKKVLALTQANLEMTVEEIAELGGLEVESSSDTAIDSASGRATEKSVCCPQSNHDFEALVPGLSHPVNDTDLLRRFWNIGGLKPMQLMAFLPCIPTHVIKAIFDQCSIEHVDSADLALLAAKRRHSLCLTTLDFRLLRQDWTALPCFRHDVIRATFDPDVDLCPYELGGECADSFCPFQHTRPHKYGSIIPREVLPLPSIDGLTQSDLSVEPPLMGRVLNEPNSTSADDSNNKPVCDSCVLNFDEDYVPLPQPPATSTDRRFETDNNNPGLNVSGGLVENMASVETSATPTSDPRRAESFWQTVWGLDPEFSVFQMHAYPLSDADSCGFLIKVVNWSCIASNAGRYDVYQVLKRLANNWEFHYQERENNSLVNTILKEIWCKAVCAMDKAFANGTSKDPDNPDIFTVALDSQLALFLVSFFLRQFESALQSTNELTVQDLKSWLAAAKEMCSGCATQESVCTTGGILTSRLIACQNTEVKDVVPEKVSRLQMAWLLSDIHKARASAQNQVTDSWPALLSDTWSEALVLIKQADDMSNGHSEYIRTSIFYQVTCALYEILRRAAEQAPSRTELLEIQRCFKGIADPLRKCAQSIPFGDLLLVPVFASTVALSCAVRQYVQAHQDLTTLVGRLCGFDRFHLSELLWSQLIQLRLTFVPVSIHANEANTTFTSSNKKLLERLELLDLHLHHLVLKGDWNLAREVNEETATTYQSLARAIIQDNEFDSTLAINLDNLSFVSRCDDDDTEACFPMSLLLGGPHITILSLNQCELRSLPSGFTRAFRNLEALYLNGNQITSLPTTLLELRELKVLYAASNKLQNLPSAFTFKKLEELDLSNNELASLPRKLSTCKELQVLRMDGNSLNLQAELSDVLSDLPKLHVLSPEIR